MLISPAEPAQLRALGKVSSIPERFGADVLIVSAAFGLVGVQRKEINDLIASVRDGRLQRELPQLKACGQAVLLIEGVLQWTNDGSLLNNGAWTRSQHHGLIWSVQSRNIWIANSSSLGDTISWLSMFTRWVAKERHSSLSHRPNVKSTWGNAESRDWGIHLLQSFEGIGPEVAARIYDHFGGVPLTWNVTIQDLMQVPGVGKSRAQTLMNALKGRPRATPAEIISAGQSAPSPSSSQTESKSGTTSENTSYNEEELRDFIELSEMD